MTCYHKWLTPEGNRTTCIQCGTDGFVSVAELELQLNQLKKTADYLLMSVENFKKQWICCPDPKPLVAVRELLFDQLNDAIKSYNLITGNNAKTKE